MPRALVVGVNYTGKDYALSGCAADARALERYLCARGYAVESLIDGEPASPTEKLPTRANILSGLLALILSGDPHLFFSFAGHGSREHDESGDEPDGKDEVICPADMDASGVISDDALRGVLQCMRPHQQLVCVFDCCHSGTGMDLKYELFDRGGTSYRFIEAAAGSTTPGQVILMSGCRDDQTSAESADPGGAGSRGALTVALVAELEVRANAGCAELLGAVRARLRRGGFDQIAQLSAGRPCTPSAPFLARSEP